MTATLNNAQIKTLRALEAAKAPMTRRQIAEAAFGGNSVNFAPILKPMVDAKPPLIKQADLDIDGKVEVVFTITASGSKAAKAGPQDLSRGAGKHANLPKVGGVIEKTYLGKAHKITVVEDGFRYQNKTYPSLTATAQAVRGSDAAINGWAFFGLVKSEPKAPKAAKSAKAEKPAKPKTAKPAKVKDAPKAEAAAAE